MLDDIRQIYIPAIGSGRAGGIARILQQQGYDVRGCTARPLPAVEALESSGISIDIGFKEEYLDGVDLVVACPDVGSDDVELMAARRANIDIVDEAQLLTTLVDGCRTIGVTGTHGRATVTSMIAWILECAGYDPGFVASTRGHNFDCAGRDSKGEWFVIELDERLATHHHIQCDYVVCNFLELVPRAYYRGVDDIVEAMADFLESNRCLKEAFVNLDCLGNRELVRQLALRPTGYALDHLAEFRAQRSEENALGFSAFHRDVELGSVELSIPGSYNAVNALGALAVASRIGIDTEVIAQALSSYEGLENRYSVASGGGVTIIKDFVRHPSAIARVLRTASRTLDARLIGVCQLPPDMYADSDNFAQRLQRCDQVVLSATSGTEQSASCKSLESLADKLRERGCEVEVVLDFSEVESHLVDGVRVGDTVVFFGDDEFLRRADHVQAELASRAARTAPEGKQPRFDGPLAEGDDSDD